VPPPAPGGQLRFAAVPSHSRNEPGSPRGNLFDKIPLGRAQLIAVGVALLAVVGVVVGLVVSGGGKPVASKQHHQTSTSTSSAPPSTTSSTLPAFPASFCPLTDTPAAGGIDPARPALAVKIGNEPGNDPAAGAGARPQSGLNEADIVFDTPTEGFLMRYIAVYQCQDASSIGPIRSARWVDWHIIRQFVHPILAFAGGINPDVDVVLHSGWIEPADVIGAQYAAASQLASREAPDATYSSTLALYGLYKKSTTPPKPVFEYSSSLPSSAKPATSVSIDFSAGTDVEWQWDASKGLWMHYYLYGGAPEADIDALSDTQVSTDNIIIQIVKYKFGPYAESPGSTGDFESQTIGTGPGWVLRDGKAIAVTWHRPYYLDGLTFTDAKGQPVDLTPGRTWVELLPNTTAAHPQNLVFTPTQSATPSGAASSTSTTSASTG
jgi:hypothetical protein